MSEPPFFHFITDEDWYWEIPFTDEASEKLELVDENGAPRIFEVFIRMSRLGTRNEAPAKVLTMDSSGSGISLSNDNSSLIFRVSQEDAKDFALGDYTAHILEVVGGERHLFLPVRIQFGEPSAVRAFLRRMIGVTWSRSRQPIVSPVAIAGRQGPPGSTIRVGTQPPGPQVGRDGDFYIEDRTGQNPPAGRRMYGPKAGGAWPGTTWIIQVSSYGDVPGLARELDNRVRVDAPQGLGEAQRAQARSNLGLSEISTMSRAQVIEFVRDALTGKEF